MNLRGHRRSRNFIDAGRNGRVGRSFKSSSKKRGRMLRKRPRRGLVRRRRRR